ncbi:putative synaptobrevin [Hamiltosporidium tvaerminnensis]|uniref:Putative synaptobrevin n=1 Tax=Hamiltosporidium tvaerminnensis TaxID=1176355 RepID=A0A4Q9KT82_9MICR|nr:putative synaptobrevin [Hamiltosporidium tvaerminnensis]
MQMKTLQTRMKDTIKSEEERGASLQDLSKRTEHLEQRATVFRQEARTTRRRMWFKNFKYYVIGGLVATVMVIIVLRIIGIA